MKKFEILGILFFIIGLVCFGIETSIKGLAAFNFLGFLGIGCFIYQNNVENNSKIKTKKNEG